MARIKVSSKVSSGGPTSVVKEAKPHITVEPVPIKKYLLDFLGNHFVEKMREVYVETDRTAKGIKGSLEDAINHAIKNPIVPDGSFAKTGDVIIGEIDRELMVYDLREIIDSDSKYVFSSTSMELNLLSFLVKGMRENKELKSGDNIDVRDALIQSTPYFLSKGSYEEDIDTSLQGRAFSHACSRVVHDWDSLPEENFKENPKVRKYLHGEGRVFLYIGRKKDGTIHPLYVHLEQRVAPRCFNLVTCEVLSELNGENYNFDIATDNAIYDMEGAGGLITIPLSASDYYTVFFSHRSNKGRLFGFDEVEGVDMKEYTHFIQIQYYINFPTRAFQTL